MYNSASGSQVLLLLCSCISCGYFIVQYWIPRQIRLRHPSCAPGHVFHCCTNSHRCSRDAWRVVSYVEKHSKHVNRTGLYRTRSDLPGQCRDFINHLLDSGPLNLFVLGGKICSVEFGRMWKVCLEMLFKLCRHIFTNQCRRNWNFCRYAKVATGSAATSVMYFTKVLRRDQSIKFGHSNLICMPVMPWRNCQAVIAQTKYNRPHLSKSSNRSIQSVVRTLCCRWARAPSSSRHPPKKRLHSRLTFVCVFSF